MRLTRALSRPVEHGVMHVDMPTSKLAGSWKEYVLETSLVFASSLLAIAMLALYAAVNAVTQGSSAVERVLNGAAAGLIFAGIMLVLLHLVRYLFWYGRSGPQRRGEPGGEVARRIPLLMSTDWDFALALAIVLVAALSA